MAEIEKVKNYTVYNEKGLEREIEKTKKAEEASKAPIDSSAIDVLNAIGEDQRKFVTLNKIREYYTTTYPRLLNDEQFIKNTPTLGTTLDDKQKAAVKPFEEDIYNYIKSLDTGSEDTALGNKIDQYPKIDTGWTSNTWGLKQKADGYKEPIDRVYHGKTTDASNKTDTYQKAEETPSATSEAGSSTPQKASSSVFNSPLSEDGRIDARTISSGAERVSSTEDVEAEETTETGDMMPIDYVNATEPEEQITTISDFYKVVPTGNNPKFRQLIVDILDADSLELINITIDKFVNENPKFSATQKMIVLLTVLIEGFKANADSLDDKEKTEIATSIHEVLKNNTENEAFQDILKALPEDIQTAIKDQNSTDGIDLIKKDLDSTEGTNLKMEVKVKKGNLSTIMDAIDTVKEKQEAQQKEEKQKEEKEEISKLFSDFGKLIANNLDGITKFMSTATTATGEQLSAEA